VLLLVTQVRRFICCLRCNTTHLIVYTLTYTCCRYLQGVFRGLQDAKTPFYATLACNILNIALEPPFIFKPLNLGVQGSALATTLAQIVPLAALLLVLQWRYNLSFKGLDMHQLGAMFAPTGFLLLRTISISAVFAAATSLVARAGPLAAAAHQVGWHRMLRFNAVLTFLLVLIIPYDKALLIWRYNSVTT
jgi:Na+-driven multidrug efflux pump